MTTSSISLAAAGKLVDIRDLLWSGGPVCQRSELKAWDIELSEFLVLVASVERAVKPTKAAVQCLRRMFYSAPLGGAGKLFDSMIETDSTRTSIPLSTKDVPQSVLDALVRIGFVHIPGASAPWNRVDISHVFVLLDLKLNGASGYGQALDVSSQLGADYYPRLSGMCSWVGDLSSAWCGFQTFKEDAKKAAGSAWSEPVSSPADVAVPLAWLDKAISERAPIEDLLGDMDAVILAQKELPDSSTPIATMLRNYYTVGIPSTGEIARVDDRFPQWITRVEPQIPFVSNATGPALSAGAGACIRSQVYWGIVAFLAKSRIGPLNTWAVLTVAPRFLAIQLELRSEWNSRMVEEIAVRFHKFLVDGLAGQTPNWPSQPSKELEYAGYAWAPSALDQVAGVTVTELEAWSQFFTNWPQPHTAMASHPLLHPLRLRNPEGLAAKLAGSGPSGLTMLEVDEFTNFDGVEVVGVSNPDHADLLYLEADTARQGKTYKIVDVNSDNCWITIEGTPVFSGQSTWKIIRRPRLVLIDPFGARMTGSDAVSNSVSTEGWVKLDTTETNLNLIRSNLDMIFLEKDQSRSTRTYRILAVNPSTSEVKLDGIPSFFFGSRWQIPAGVARTKNSLAEALTPDSLGCDAYDGLLYVVYDDKVQGKPFRFTSFSSRNWANQDFRSSITGNACYAVRSFCSTDSWKNYSLKVTDHDQINADKVKLAAYYNDGVTSLGIVSPKTEYVRPDTDGKESIRLHCGHIQGEDVADPNGYQGRTGSAGCLVSPEFPACRALLISLHQSERLLLGLEEDSDLAEIAQAKTQKDSEKLYGKVATNAWADRLKFELILVRPELRPTENKANTDTNNNNSIDCGLRSATLIFPH